LASPSISGTSTFQPSFQQADVNVLKKKWYKYWCYHIKKWIY
jgi:hypothetical protein